MGSITSLLAALEETAIARNIGNAHDDARVRYHLNTNTVRNSDEFYEIIGDYYAYHFSQCVARGSTLSRVDATGKAKLLIENEYRRRRGDIVSALHDAKDGTNGGVRGILDVIAETLKLEAVENYIRDAFDRHIKREAYEDQVEIIRQFIAHCGVYLSSEVRNARHEQYARDYEHLIRSYVDSLRNSSSMFRRLAG